MKISKTTAKQILVKSNLPASDYVANPYSGCTHNCQYCYASFMKRFTGHSEDWGTFIDIKEYQSNKLPANLNDKVILLSSVTDPYNPYELKYHNSRKILELLKNSGANIEILSKSDLMVHDIELLKQIPNLTVGISMNTLDDNFRKEMEPNAPSIERRIKALKTLYSEGISTYLFISPIFPYISDISSIVEVVHNFVDKICFENLNLRGASKDIILNYISTEYPKYLPDYRNIYNKGDTSYWKNLELQIDELSKKYNIPFINFFYHSKIKKGAKKND